MKLVRKMIKLSLKDNMGPTSCSLIQIPKNISKLKKNKGSVRNLFSILKWQYGLNRFVLDSYFINI